MSFVAERKEIENYLRSFGVEQALDESLNRVLLARPRNPFPPLAENLRSFVMPEILEVKLNSTLVNGVDGVRATVSTSLGDFHAITTFARTTYEYGPLPPYVEPGEAFEPVVAKGGGKGGGKGKNDKSAAPVAEVVVENSDGTTAPNTNSAEGSRNSYSVESSKLTEALKEVDPRDLRAVDTALLSIHDLRPAESLAVSVALARAGAAYRQIPLYEYLAQAADASIDSMQLPLPVITMGTHFASHARVLQTVSLYSTNTNSLEECLSRLSSFHRTLLGSKNASRPVLWTTRGTPSISGLSNFEDLVRYISTIARTEVLNRMKAESKTSAAAAVEIPQIADGWRLGVNCMAGQLVKPVEGNASFVYRLESGNNKSGADMAEALIQLWLETELVNADLPVAEQDISGLRVLRRRIGEVVNESANVEKLAYQKNFGVGQDKECLLQVPIDAVMFESIQNNIEKIRHELPFNALRLSPHHFRTLSCAMNTWKTSRQYGWATIVDGSGSSPRYQFFDLPIETPVTVDTFDVDLAVALGAGQIQLDGLGSASVTSRIERLRTIADMNSRLPFAGELFRK